MVGLEVSPSPFRKEPLNGGEDSDFGEILNFGDCLRRLANESLLLGFRDFESDDFGEGVKTPAKVLVRDVGVIGLGIELPPRVIRSLHEIVSYRWKTSQEEVNEPMVVDICHCTFLFW